MVHFAPIALFALAAVASVGARPLRRQLSHEEILPRLLADELSERDVLPLLTARDLRNIVMEVRLAARKDKNAAACDNGAVAAPPPPANNKNGGGGGAFKQLAYKDFQISSGVAGNADAEAKAVLSAFDGVDLSTVLDADAKAVEAMRQEAESAETDLFNPQIDAASGDAKTALENGKIKNKVLKLTLESFGLQVKLAKAQAGGKDSASVQSKLDEENTKLNNNISTDKKNAGEASQAVA